MSATCNWEAAILLAEDCDDDAFILSRAFHRLGLSPDIIRVKDGQEAISYLVGHKRPDLLVLDLKMPKMDGFDVLGFIRMHPQLKDLPVFVLTGSDLPQDKVNAEKIGIQGYFIKSIDSTYSATALMARFRELPAA